MDDYEADFRIAWLHDDDEDRSAFTDEYRAIVLEDEQRKREAFEEYQRTFRDEVIVGPEACRICNGEGYSVDDGAVVNCHACAGSGARNSITPQVAECTDKMMAQMLSRIT